MINFHPCSTYDKQFIVASKDFIIALNFSDLQDDIRERARVAVPIKGDQSGQKVGLEIAGEDLLSNKMKRHILFKHNVKSEEERAKYSKRIKVLNESAVVLERNIQYL